MGQLADDVLAMVTGFGSIWVRHPATGTVSRGLLDDEEVSTEVGGMLLVGTRQVLRVAVATFGSVAAEDTLELGAVEDDDTVTTYRVVESPRKEADGLVLRLALTR